MQNLILTTQLTFQELKENGIASKCDPPKDFWNNGRVGRGKGRQ